METISALLAFCGGNSPLKGQWRRALMFYLIYAWNESRATNGYASDLRRYRAHYDVIVMMRPAMEMALSTLLAICLTKFKVVSIMTTKSFSSRECWRWIAVVSFYPPQQCLIKTQACWHSYEWKFKGNLNLNPDSRFCLHDAICCNPDQWVKSDVRVFYLIFYKTYVNAELKCCV